MTQKLKSLLFLTCFIICAIIYHYIEENEKNESKLKTENFVTTEMIDLNETENTNSDIEVFNED